MAGLGNTTSNDFALAMPILESVSAPTISSDLVVMAFRFSLHPVGRHQELFVSNANVRFCQCIFVGFLTLLVCLWLTARHFSVTVHFWTGISITLLLAPYWAFGFGIETWLRSHTNIAVALAWLSASYLVFALPEHQFRWDLFLGMIAVSTAVLVLLRYVDGPAPRWSDWLALAILGICVDLHFFDRAWPGVGLNGLPKLLFVDAGLYGYLVVRPVGDIGFHLRPRLSDFAFGLREFLFFAPVAIVLGFAFGFLHLHRTFPTSAGFGAGWVFTLFFVAVPEELFFRGLILNLLARRIGTTRAVAISSLLFGLAHFNKRATYFNWRYVILAAIAGIFYARAWLANRRLLASSITHATVDTVWSIWLR